MPTTIAERTVFASNSEKDHSVHLQKAEEASGVENCTPVLNKAGDLTEAAVNRIAQSGNERPSETLDSRADSKHTESTARTDSTDSTTSSTANLSFRGPLKRPSSSQSVASEAKRGRQESSENTRGDSVPLHQPIESNVAKTAVGPVAEEVSVSKVCQDTLSTDISNMGCPDGGDVRMVAVNGHSDEVDQELYSRQLGTYGHDTMSRLIKMKVIISGLRGVGIEIAKNLILAGPAEVLLHDDTLVEPRDLASNFCISEGKMNGKTRAEGSKVFLEDLNHYVAVKVHHGPLDSVIPNYDLMVISNAKRSELIRYNKICRACRPQVGMIFAETFGLCGCIYVDFGDHFTIHNKTGEEPKSAIVAGVTSASQGIVSLHTDKPSPFNDGDYVVFREVEGMTELNDSKPRPIHITDKHEFTIGDTSAFGNYTRGGIVTEVKMPTLKSYAPLEERLSCPVGPDGYLVTPDLGKFGRPEQLHFAIGAILECQETESPDFVEACVSAAKKRNEECKANSSFHVDEVDDAIVRLAAQNAAVSFAPLASFIGGIAAQEIVKFTGKYTSIYQWFYYDAFEVTRNLVSPRGGISMSRPSDGDRYDDLKSLWGVDKQQALADLNIFLVGAGALGCEIIKLLALTGACTGKGQLTVADMDNIETSNLNRQFLFRRQHVGRSKAAIAAAAAREMNPRINVLPSEVKLEPATEDRYDDDFWQGLDIVINALDNVPSRLYVDSRCVWYGKPLMESGTLGTKANVQVIAPTLTEAYGDSQDPPEESIPLCTLKHFPYEIEHTVEWGRDLFQALFTDGPQEALQFLKDPETFLSKLEREGTSGLQKEKLNKIHEILGLQDAANSPNLASMGGDVGLCIVHAIKLFHELFHQNIKQLLHNFPPDHVNSDGQLFWSGPKRAPVPQSFDAQDPLHRSFVKSAASLFAHSAAIKKQVTDDELDKIAPTVDLPPFEPRQVYIKTDDSDVTPEGGVDDFDGLEALRQKLFKEVHRRKEDKFAAIVPSEFEKDDPTNFHVEFIWAVGNLRARNYRIQECDRHRAKMISGKIIPAIATTTAMITGLVFIEALKLVDTPKRPIEDYRNAFIDLSTSQWIFSEPLPPHRVRAKEYDHIACGPIRTFPPGGFTSWDKIEIRKANGTLADLVKEVETLADVSVAIVSVGDVCLYNSFLPAHKKRLNEPIKQLYETVAKTTIPPKRRYLTCELSCSANSDSVDIVMPSIGFYFSE